MPEARFLRSLSSSPDSVVAIALSSYLSREHAAHRFELHPRSHGDLCRRQRRMGRSSSKKFFRFQVTLRSELDQVIRAATPAARIFCFLPELLAASSLSDDRYRLRHD